MLPNRFPDAGEEPEYNTIDATLWYVEAIRAYHAATGDDSLLAELYPVLQDIVDWHRRGTRYNIHLDEADGLLYGGSRRGAADLDGRQAGRLGGDAAHRQAGGDQRAVVQRAAQPGRLRPPSGPCRRCRRLRRAWPTQTEAAFSASGTTERATATTCWTAPTATIRACGPTSFSPSRCPTVR